MTQQDNNSRYFHFTLGPVQSFVGQARRTRDFWAGSFLLSWLSGVAMQSVISQGGEILFPEADQDFLDALTGETDASSGNNIPKQGSLPNRFKAKVSEGFDAAKVVADVQTVWKQLADELFQKELASIALADTKAIWDRQVESFWDMRWVMVSDVEDSSALDRRKNMRSHFMPAEAGIKCSLMGDWQELSGIVGVRKKDREARQAFWTAVSENSLTDFTLKEQLCALSYIKRRFLEVFNTLKIQLDGWAAHGWVLPTSVPSVAYIAAAPWYAKVLEQAEDTDEFVMFYEGAKKLNGLSEYKSTIGCVDSASTNRQHKGLDGNVFHIASLENENITPDKAQAKHVIKHLKSLKEKFGDISPFYAVLMMDGDSLGKQMSNRNKQTHITEGLAAFTQAVPQIVQENNGFLIYAGGDDVLALVTLEDALTCAEKVRTHYMSCFEDKPVDTTISAAIIYTHVNTPLKNVLHESHELLDDIAKEKTGRDAVAVRVYKGSGISSQWSKNWNDALDPEGGFKLNSIVNTFEASGIESHEGVLSSGFFYKIRERFSLFGGDEAADNLAFEDMLNLMTMEYLQSGDNRKLGFDEAKEIITPLMEQCRSTRRNTAGETEKMNHMTVDAALLVRFLAQKGIEGGRA